MNHTNSLLKKVLYQKLGNKWYLFSIDNEGDVIYTSLPEGSHPALTEKELFCIVNLENEIEKRKSKSSKNNKEEKMLRRNQYGTCS